MSREIAQQSAPPAFDIDEFTLIPRLKLTALSFILSQARIDSGPSSDVCYGLSYILDDIRDALTEAAHTAADTKRGAR